MRLSRLSLISIAGCLIGLAAMVVVGSIMLNQMSARQTEMQSFLVLENRIDNFSAASDALLVQRAAPSTWASFRNEAAELQQLLAEKQDEHPAAQKAIHHIGEIVSALGSFYAGSGGKGKDADGSDPQAASRNEDEFFSDPALVIQVADHGSAIDQAMSDIGDQQLMAVSNSVNWIVGGFALTALVFGIGCVLALALLYRRIHGPLRSLVRITSRVEEGDSHIRAQPKGHDEFSELARTFNRMLDRQQLDKDRLEERARLLDIADRVARFGGWWVDLRDNHCHWSDVVADIHGLPRDYCPPVEEGISFYAPEHRELIRQRFLACAESGKPYDEQLQIITADGKRRWVRTIGVAVRDDLGTIIKVEGAFQDVTAEHEKTESLQQALKLRHAMIDSLPAHIAVLDEDGNIFDINDYWKQYGIENANPDRNLSLGRNYLDVCHNATGTGSDDARKTEAGLSALLKGERDKFSLEYPCNSPTQEQWFRLMASRLESPENHESQPLGAVVMHVDITERKVAERQLEKLAYEDSLTGLLNRSGFTSSLNQYLNEAGWQPNSLVALIDIKGQSNINDVHGYDTGDKLLRQVGARLKDKLDNHILGCTDGDSFILFLPEVHPDDVEKQWKLLGAVFKKPFLLDEIILEVSARFGFTALGDEQRSAERLLHEAEMALFEARGRGIRDWDSYTPRLDQEIHERSELTRDLRRALAEDQLELHYQPKVKLGTGELISCEALLRWVHPERGMLSPGLFIPVAEQSQLIGPIGKWVLFEACRQLREWQDARLEVVRVAVNVSVVQFELGGLIEQVREAIRTYDIDPGNLTLEITESVFAHQSDILLTQMRELHELGVRLSLDDFGTGYSSLLYLQSYPFDEIKIDMGFVRKLLDDPYSQRIVTTVLGISKVLGADTVAEGIESPEIRDMLLEMGCDIGQGYYYSMPLAAEDFQWLLEQSPNLSPITLADGREFSESSDSGH